jgi:hypothetical protein
MKHWSHVRFLILVLAVGTVTGCATHRIDWSKRVGHYTLDQALLELGPPDKEARLSDGTVVANWLTRRGRSAFYTGSGGYYRGPYGYGGPGPAYLATVSPDYFLRLTFRPDGVLSDWKKYAQ